MKKGFFMGARSTKILLTFLFLLVSSVVQAEEWFESYRNARSLGMGGALIGLTSDETSLYRNPANLGSVRGIFGTAFDPEAEGSANFTDVITASDFSKAGKIETSAKKLAAMPNEYFHSRQQFTPSFVKRNFGFGVVYREEISAFSGAVSTPINVKYQNDFGVILGVNQSLFGGVVKIGASAKAFNRLEVVSGTLATSGTFAISTIGKEGSAISLTGGVIIQLPVAALPTLAVVGRDLGNTVFNKKDGVRGTATGRPTEVKQSIDVALSLFPIHANKIRSMWTLEYRDITDSREDDDTMKRVHFGSELNLRDIFYIRAGLNQRYFTAGFEIASENVGWQLATYGEEVGTKTIPKEDRRYVTRIMVRF